MGVALAEQSYRLTMRNTTFNIRGLPVMWWPWSSQDAQTSDVPLSRLQVGSNGRFGTGVESDWYLFRILGLIRPVGFDSKLSVDAYDRGEGVGVNMSYLRETHAGYIKSYLFHDRDQLDDFGQVRKDVPAPDSRGRMLWRHKQYLPENWEVQSEFNYESDRNFLEQFYRSDFYAGKDRENLVYVKKQQDNWAVTGLVKAQLNNFITTRESLPEVGMHLIGQPVGETGITVFGDARLGITRNKVGDNLNSPSPVPPNTAAANAFTRGEAMLPMHWGPVNVAPFATGSLKYLSEWFDGKGMVGTSVGGGVRANMHITRVYDDCDSRLLDINRLRHVVTPEVVAFGMCSNIYSDFDDTDEREDLNSFQGVKIGIKQRWQTYRLYFVRR